MAEMTNLHMMLKHVAENPPDNPTEPLEISFRRMLSEDAVEFYKMYHRLEKEYFDQCKAEEAAAESRPKGDIGTQKCVEMAERLLEQITGKKLEKSHG